MLLSSNSLLPSVSASIRKCPVDAHRASVLTKRVLDACGIGQSLEKEVASSVVHTDHGPRSSRRPRVLCVSSSKGSTLCTEMGAGWNCRNCSCVRSSRKVWRTLAESRSPRRRSGSRARSGLCLYMPRPKNLFELRLLDRPARMNDSIRLAIPVTRREDLRFTVVGVGRRIGENHRNRRKLGFSWNMTSQWRFSN